MFRDEVRLEFNGKSVTDFISYEVTANIFNPAGKFDIELANPEVDVTEGSKCKLYVNGRIELAGVVDVVTDTGAKSISSLRVSGRDYMGVLVDSHVTVFETLDSNELKELTATLLKDAPFINRSNIIYGKGTRAKIEEQEGFNFNTGMIQLKPGDSIFDVLNRTAMTRGLRFYTMPNGTFIYGKPRTSGRAEFSLVRRKDGRGNNIESGRRTKNISKAHSHIIVMAQGQGGPSMPVGGNNLSVKLENKDVPFYKPRVIEAEGDGVMGEAELKEFAARVLEQERYEALQFEYTVAGHSQNGRNWQTNAICHVHDEDGKLRQKTDRLIYGRTLKGGKDEGATTALTISRLGVVPG